MLQNAINLIMFTEEGSNISSKNPFQSASTNDFFANKNPFFNGSWSVAGGPVPVNPFMVSGLFYQV